MKQILTAILAIGLSACSAPATPAPPALPAAPAVPAPPACLTETPNMADAEAVADAAAYYLTCIDAADTSPTDHIIRAEPYLTESTYATLVTSSAKPSSYWNLTVSASASTTVTIERLYMENYPPEATGTMTLDRQAASTSPSAGTQITYYTLTIEPQPDGTYRVSDVAATN